MMEVGDVVRLKSGGPSMTIVSIDMVFARCMWFEHWENGTSHELFIRLACLEKEEPPAAPPSYADDERLRTLREFKARREAEEAAERAVAAARAELSAAMEAEAAATGEDLVAAVQRRLRAEEVEARLSDDGDGDLGGVIYQSAWDHATVGPDGTIRVNVKRLSDEPGTF